MRGGELGWYGIERAVDTGTAVMSPKAPFPLQPRLRARLADNAQCHRKHQQTQCTTNSTSQHVVSPVVIGYHVTCFQLRYVFPRCIECHRGVAMRKKSVCRSVRQSVCLSNACIVTKRKKDLSRFLYHTVHTDPPSVVVCLSIALQSEVGNALSVAYW